MNTKFVQEGPMHWFFYIVAGLVTALAIYVQMKRFYPGAKGDELREKDAPSNEKEKGGS
jgi:hypothetical protein